MTMHTLESIIKIFELTNSSFIKAEAKAILNNVSERNFCGSLMKYLELNKPKGYYTDVEYNRKQDGKLKTIFNHNLEIVNITCDLILHSRGEDVKQDNLLALEMKKKRSPAHAKHADRIRLICLTKDSFDDVWSYDGKTHPDHVCRYVLGVYYEIDKLNKSILVEYYSQGKLIHSYTQNLT